MLTQVKRDCLGLFIYDFLLVFNSNIYPTLWPLMIYKSDFDLDI